MTDKARGTDVLPPRVLCVLNDEQRAEYEPDFAKMRRANVEWKHESSVDDALERIGRDPPGLVIVGMDLGATEGLEFLALLFQRYRDFSGQVVVLPNKTDPFPPMLQMRDAATGRSRTVQTDLTELAQMAAALAPPAPTQPRPKPKGMLTQLGIGGVPLGKPAPQVSAAGAPAGAAKPDLMRLTRLGIGAPATPNQPAKPVAPSAAAPTRAKPDPMKLTQLGLGSATAVAPPGGSSIQPTATVPVHGAARSAVAETSPSEPATEPRKPAALQTVVMSPSQGAPAARSAGTGAPMQPPAVAAGPAAQGPAEPAAAPVPTTEAPEGSVPPPQAEAAWTEPAAAPGLSSVPAPSPHLGSQPPAAMPSYAPPEGRDGSWRWIAAALSLLVLAAGGTAAVVLALWVRQAEPLAPASTAAQLPSAAPAVATTARPHTSPPPSSQPAAQASTKAAGSAATGAGNAPDFGRRLTLPLSFARGSAGFAVRDGEQLEVIVSAIRTALAKDPGAQVEVGGHASSDGEKAVNVDLGYARATKVAKYLVAQGIAPQRIVTRSYADAEPAETDAKSPANRRVTVTLQSAD